MTKRCAIEGCGTILSRFNQGEFCAVHGGEDYRAETPAPKPIRERISGPRLACGDGGY